MSPSSRFYRKGDVLFHEGDEASSIYLIRQGQVSIRKSTDSGTVEIGQVGTNQVIGELAFFDRQVRSAEAVVLTSAEVVEIPFSSLDPIYQQTPDYLKKIMMTLATRLREADETIKQLKEKSGLQIFDSDATTTEDSEVEKILALTSKPTEDGPS